MSKLQSIKTAMKRAEAPFNSSEFRQTCEKLRIDDKWGYEHSAVKRTVEMELSSPAHAARLCIHHGTEAIAQAEQFYRKSVKPVPMTDFAGTKKLWRDFPLNVRARLQPVFDCSTRFDGISELEVRFQMWESEYNRHFAAIVQVVQLEKRHRQNDEFHRLYLRAFKALLPELEDILVDLVGLAG